MREVFFARVSDSGRRHLSVAEDFCRSFEIVFFLLRQTRMNRNIQTGHAHLARSPANILPRLPCIHILIRANRPMLVEHISLLRAQSLIIRYNLRRAGPTFFLGDESDTGFDLLL